MRLKVFCVYDSKLKVWATPFFDRHAGSAVRGWEEHVNDGQSMPSKYPNDYTLFELGEFDDDSGKLIGHLAAIELCTAVQAKQRAVREVPGAQTDFIEDAEAARMRTKSAVAGPRQA